MIGRTVGHHRNLERLGGSVGRRLGIRPRNCSFAELPCPLSRPPTRFSRHLPNVRAATASLLLVLLPGFAALSQSAPLVEAVEVRVASIDVVVTDERVASGVRSRNYTLVIAKV